MEQAIRVTRDYVKEFKLLPSESRIFELDGSDVIHINKDTVIELKRILLEYQIPEIYFRFIYYSIGNLTAWKRHKKSKSEKENMNFATFVRNVCNHEFNQIDKITLGIEGITIEGHKDFRFTIVHHLILKKDLAKIIIKGLKKYNVSAKDKRETGDFDPAYQERLSNLAYNLTLISELKARKLFTELLEVAQLPGRATKHFKHL